MSFRMKNGKSNFTLLDEFIKLSKQKKSEVAVGLVKDYNALYPNGQDVVSVGIINEFGTDKIPARPFMKQALIKSEDKLNKLRRGLIKKIISKKITLKEAMEKIGLFMQIQIQREINSGDFIENAESTKRQKPAGLNPLQGIHHLLVRSINYQVREKK
jgi:hypothetical protein